MNSLKRNPIQSNELTPGTPVANLFGVGPEVAARLARLRIKTVADLLYHFPRRYEDWRAVVPIADVRVGPDVVIRAVASDVTVTSSPRKRLPLVRARLRDDSGAINALWFGQAYLERFLKISRPLFYRGSVRRSPIDRSLELVGPAIERVASLQPIYPETVGISSKRLRQLVAIVLESLDELPDPLPAAICEAEGLVPRAAALRILHQPESLDQLSAARERIAFEELFLWLAGLRQLRRDLTGQPAPQLAATETELRTFAAGLPFTLTDDQRRTAWRIIQDLGERRPMHRLLQGDVGTGKTAVAAFAAYVAARAGCQTVWLAPTEILAEQHHVTLSHLLEPFDIPVHLWTRTQKYRNIEISKYRNSVTVGTHALLSESLDFPHLGLVIVDEQHRFGVAQRAYLRERTNAHGLVPHFLSMTATPIPRTLALALFGDLDLSLIRERPPGRQPVTTEVIRPQQRQRIRTIVEREIGAGHQIFVVCPLIETAASDRLPGIGDDRRSAEAEYVRIRRELPTARIGLVHGRLRARDKTRVMADFAAGRLDLLVATTVIEVGIDIPNATVMLIEGANRFGLSQLHQLRGRIGRGAHAGICLLAADQWSDLVAERLGAMVATDDGLKLAETDLRLRGPGELIGTVQSGLPDFKMASLFDTALIARVQAAVAGLSKIALAGIASLTAVRHGLPAVRHGLPAGRQE